VGNGKPWKDMPMAVDPYAPCPCGSGEKYKWCCQKVEEFLERSQRLGHQGQIEAAIQAVDEGLRQHPENSMLSLRKVALLLHKDRPDQARPIAEKLAARMPGNPAAQAMLIRLLLETGEFEPAAHQFQVALGACPPDRSQALAWTAQYIGARLSEAGLYPAALAHLELAHQLDPELNRGQAEQVDLVPVIERNPATPLPLRYRHRLSPAPATLDRRLHSRFEQALQWAQAGSWNSAASSFETLSGDGAGPAADRNLGLCRLWTCDHAAAVKALRRYITAAGDTPDALELEALCQIIWPMKEDDFVEHVQLIWPVKDRAALLNALRQADHVTFVGRAPINPTEEHAPEVDYYALLDRPVLRRSAGLTAADIPRVLGHVLLGLEIVALEGFDDERLGALSDRFTQLAGTSIPPAHPRTKVLDVAVRSTLPFQQEWLVPEGVSAEDRAELEREKDAQTLLDVWPQTPQAFLGRRTPLQALQSGKAIDRIAVKAAVWRMEVASRFPRGDHTFARLREKLGIEPERELDPAGIDIENISPMRLNLVPAERLTDEALIALYRRSKKYAESTAIVRSARALSERPHLFPKQVDPGAVFGDLAYDAAANNEREAMLGFIERGRAAETERNSKAAARWDLTEIECRMFLEPPANWAPALAGVLDRYAGDKAANEVVLQKLIAMKLIAIAPHPENPDQMLLDSRPLQALLTQFGPRVAPASATVGKPGIWTPQSAAAPAAGGVWTPGSEPAPGDKPKLIIPGR
jgi:tetratricopeptide (TPR) repeat protein